ncbi:CMGC/DYRK/PRP4 protein kinase [Saprolegnia parasitica CBS 223.65]|uniref:non-specific serine/threonine protein kinase n=1 Tax=Saprolegnia parasitica (strain CBS 223.65) TaxID=695850 RepID=A0A067CKB9_SAPPC|nr:CMGC/DYRK/PRP4 protein kinase [Saprolegnia parasitica CBS 223.65]KDO27202.1 CMGC/DYRK/PRP4 protein kinase [Saprolegnia parasitica CBS 223.65]|eukprot:XP_012201980.1 CMGC/DYRK/PRP4 protein kinase [Saprolegnia parasitica CBS 223.65]
MDAKPTTTREQRSKSPDRKRRHGRSRSRSRERSRRDRDRRHRSRSRDRSPRRGHKRPKRRSRSRSAEPKKVATKEPALKSSPTIGPAPKPEVKESAAVRSIADIFSVSHSPVVVAASKPVSVTIPIKLTELTRGTKEVKRTVDPETTESTPSVNETDSSVTSNLPSAALAPSTSVTPSGIAKVDVGSMKMDILKALAAAKSSIAGFKKPPAPVVAPPAVPITSPEPSMAELPSTQEDQGSVDSATIVNDKVDEADDNDDDDDDSNDECFDLDLRKTAKAGNESDERAMMEETVVEVPAEEAAPAPSPPKDEAPADEDDDDFDMFAADDDDFAARVPNAPARPAILKATRGHCDDSEGYYRPTIGEVLNGEFRVVGNAGKGVFSTVLLCKRIHGDEKTVAIKLIRANDTMREAAQTEIRLLTELQVGHKAKYIVKLLSTFEHRNHTAMVFEPMQMNVREAMKKFGGRDGLSLRGVKVFCKQLLFGLDHLSKHQVVHADIKPDNMLLDEKQSMVKLCDFGSAFKSTGPDAHDPTPYLVSRFYRAPEIILGLAYDAPVDMWSIGCCIYEMYTGRVMFPGQTNNEMLKLFMEVKGRFPAKLLRRHRAVYVDKFLMEPHFDEELRFISREIDRVTAKPMLRVMNNMNATKDLGTSLAAARAPSDDKKQLLDLKDLLDKVFILDPAKRITVKEALKHPFLQSS